MVCSSCDGRCCCDSCCRCVRSWHVCNRSRSNSNTRYTLLHRHLGHNRALFARHSLAGCRKWQIRLISKRTSRELVPHFSCCTNNFRPGDGSMSIHLLCLLPCLHPTCKSSAELLGRRLLRLLAHQLQGAHAPLPPWQRSPPTSQHSFLLVRKTWPSFALGLGQMWPR